MRKYLIVILLFFCFLNLTSQTKSEIDSLKILLKNSKEDTTSVKLLNKIAHKFYYFAPDSTYKYANQALQISKEEKYILGKANSYGMLGLLYLNKTEYDKALKQFFLSLKEFQNINRVKDIALIYTNIGIVYKHKADYNTALKYYLATLKIVKSTNDSLKISLAYNNVGIIYKNLKNYDKALEFYKKSLKIKNKIKDKAEIPYVLGNIGIIYLEKKQYKKAVKYLSQVLDMFIELNKKNEIANTYLMLGKLYFLQNKYKISLDNLNNAIKIFSETKNKSGLAESYIYKGNVFFALKKLNKADKFLKSGMQISKEIGSKELELESYLYLSKLDSSRNRFQKALTFYHKYTKLKDSIFSKENNEAIAIIQGKYNTADKERENILLIKNKEIDEIRIKRQKILNYAIGSILILLLIVVLIIIFTNKKLKIYKNELEILVNKRTKELNNALITAQNSDRLKTEFLENLSHEVRTPMNAISGFAALITKDISNFKDEYLYEVQKASNDLMNTIDRLVIFSKFQLEQYKIDPVALKLEEYFRELKQIVFKRKELLKKDDINIKFDIKFKELPDIFICDKYVLDNIIKELIENAFKFTEKGTITVKARIINDNNLCLLIKDTGTGIKKEIIPHIFDLMRKFDKEDVLYRGMGVGLAIVKKAVEILSGEMKINSVYKEGAELTIIIPEVKN